MESRRLGRSGIDVSAVGVGCWAAGGPFRIGNVALGWGHHDQQETIRALRSAIDLGVTLFDTADAYGCGRSEELLGTAIAGRRDEVVIATKFGNVFDADAIIGFDTSPSYIRAACDASLSRLGTDHIDLYQLHGHSWAIDDLEPTVETLTELVAAGKIRAYGWSTPDVTKAAAFAAISESSVIQHSLNVLEDAPEMVALCSGWGMASLANTPLCRGLLSGRFRPGDKINDPDDHRSYPTSHYFRVGGPSAELLERLAVVREVLTTDGRSLVQGALAWLLARTPTAVPIPGFRTEAQVRENAAVLASGPMPPDQFEAVERLLARANTEDETP